MVPRSGITRHRGGSARRLGAPHWERRRPRRPVLTIAFDIRVRADHARSRAGSGATNPTERHLRREFVGTHVPPHVSRRIVRAVFGRCHDPAPRGVLERLDVGEIATALPLPNALLRLRPARPLFARSGMAPAGGWSRVRPRPSKRRGWRSPAAAERAGRPRSRAKRVPRGGHPLSPCHDAPVNWREVAARRPWTRRPWWPFTSPRRARMPADLPHIARHR